MKNCLVKPGSKVSLDKWDTDGKSEMSFGKEKAKDKLKELVADLRKLQCILYAEHKHKLLIILQAMDTAGKDSTIRHVFTGVNPQGVRVASFKAPTQVELDHDYLWRVHRKAPARGEIAIFNRSHYEDVLVVKVHDLVPPEVWKKRYSQINDFERMLSEEGTTIIKFFLHIDGKEQKKRIRERLDDPKKAWKFSEDDLKERKFWDDYQKAYAEAISQTSTAWAPWHIIPANEKWCRNLLVTSVIVDKLKKLGKTGTYQFFADELREKVKELAGRV